MLIYVNLNAKGIRMKLFWIISLILLVVSGCTQEPNPEIAIKAQKQDVAIVTPKSQSEIAIEFARTGNYELLSDEDKSIYTKDELGSSWSHLNQYLDPTSKYFELEKFLIGKISFKATSIKENEVVITTIYPKVFMNISFELLDIKDNAKKIENLYLAFKSNKLTPSDFKFEQLETTYKFTDSGIFLNLAIKKEKKELVLSISQYTDMANELFMLIIYSSDDIEKFNLLLEQSKNLEKNIEKVSEVKSKLLDIDSEYSSFSIENYIETANRALVISRKFYELINNIEYKDLRIAKSKGGDLAIFGSYKYTGKENIKLSHFIAKFFDKDGVLISKQKLEYFASDLFYGKVKSFGFSISDQLVAKSASKVEIEPITIFGH